MSNFVPKASIIYVYKDFNYFSPQGSEEIIKIVEPCQFFPKNIVGKGLMKKSQYGQRGL